MFSTESSSDELLVGLQRNRLKMVQHHQGGAKTVHGVTVSHLYHGYAAIRANRGGDTVSACSGEKVVTERAVFNGV